MIISDVSFNKQIEPRLACVDMITPREIDGSKRHSICP
jgi:hypothetical protein